MHLIMKNIVNDAICNDTSSMTKDQSIQDCVPIKVFSLACFLSFIILTRHILFREFCCGGNNGEQNASRFCESYKSRI